MGKKSKNKSKNQRKSLPKEERKERKDAIASIEHMISELQVRASPSKCHHWDSSKRHEVLFFVGMKSINEEEDFEKGTSLLLKWSLPENRSIADALLGMAADLCLRYKDCTVRHSLLKRLIFGHFMLQELVARRDQDVTKPITHEEAHMIVSFAFVALKEKVETALDAIEYLYKKIECDCLEGLEQELKQVPDLSCCDYLACQKVKEKKDLLLCAKCKVTPYCSRECQVAHWETHKKYCKILCQERERRLKENQD